MDRKNVLLKLTGEIFSGTSHKPITANAARSIALEIKTLQDQYQFNIVIGGGNFFRGSKQGIDLQLRASVAHQVGMVATLMNGLILQELFNQLSVSSILFSAIDCPSVGYALSPQAISSALHQNKICIFVGGTGNPYFTTDSTAIIRALQTQAKEVWKATLVDGIYDSDPKLNPAAHKIATISYDELLHKRLAIMDATAIMLAQEHSIKIRVFNIFSPNALTNASTNELFGSSICKLDKEQYDSNKIDRHQSERIRDCR